MKIGIICRSITLLGSCTFLLGGMQSNQYLKDHCSPPDSYAPVDAYHICANSKRDRTQQFGIAFFALAIALSGVNIDDIVE